MWLSMSGTGFSEPETITLGETWPPRTPSDHLSLTVCVHLVAALLTLAHICVFVISIAVTSRQLYMSRLSSVLSSGELGALSRPRYRTARQYGALGCLPHEKSKATGHFRFPQAKHLPRGGPHAHLASRCSTASTRPRHHSLAGTVPAQHTRCSASFLIDFMPLEFFVVFGYHMLPTPRAQRTYAPSRS